MARISVFLRLGAALTLVVLSVAAAGPAVAAGPSPAGSSPAAASVPGTPLPPGWEQCILQGIGAPGTADNVADLDEWQVAEGGSTNNAAAYNPFNTRQMADATGDGLPVTAAPGGFPAFSSWAAGCAATVGTLEQPDMAPIVAALQAGNVSPPGLFLAAVDQSVWCAPSSDGVPCYADAILAGELLRTLLSGRSVQLNAVLSSYSDTGTDLHTYEKTAYVVAVEGGLVAERNAELDAAEQALSGARASLSTAVHALRRMALHDYTTGAVMRFNSGLGLVAVGGEGVAAGYYRSVAIDQAVRILDQASAVFNATNAKDRLAQTAAAQATAAANAASAAQQQALQSLESDVNGLEGSLSCTSPSSVATTATPATGATNAGQLWQDLQSCLAPSASTATPAAGTAAS